MAKRVAAIHDLSGLGRCSLTAAIPVLSALGVQACPVPTAVLSDQTGFPEYFMADGTAWIDRFTEYWQRCDMTLDGIFTGFLANETQVDGIERLIAAFRTGNTLVLVDPVMGDEGRIYATYTPGMCRRVAALAETADVITPNLTEACFLAGEKYADYAAAPPSKAAQLAERLTLDGRRQVIVTGVHHDGYVYNIAAGKETFSVRGHLLRGHFSGTGDLFSSVICGCGVQGFSWREATEAAADFVVAALEKTQGAPEHGVEFEECLSLLTDFMQKKKE